MREYEVLASRIAHADQILVTAHIRPDGDAIGSVLAFHAVLKRLRRPSVPLIADHLGPRYAWMEGQEEVRWELPNPAPDLVLALDTATAERLFPPVRELVGKVFIANIDHHSTNEQYGDVNIVLPDAPSTTCILYDLFQVLDYPIDPSIANLLYAGLLIDTGGFQFRNTTPEAFRVARALVEAGADPEMVYHEVIATRTPAHFWLLRKALEHVRVEEEIGLLYTYLTQEDIQAVDAENTDFERLPETLREWQGVRLVLLFMEGRDGQRVKVSLRSRRGVDVRPLAEEFHGGGHENAAGASPEGDLQSVMQRMVARARELLSGE